MQYQPYQVVPGYMSPAGAYAPPPVPQVPVQPMPEQRPPVAAPVQTVQQHGNGILWVQGEAGARSYMVAPGASVLLMDSDSEAFYIKSADPSGMPMPLRIFDYKERVSKPVRRQDAPQDAAASSAPAADYVTRAEFESFSRMVEEALSTPSPTKS